MFYLSISILCDFKFVLNYSSEGNIVLKLYLNLKKFHLKKIDKLILYNALLKIRQVVPKAFVLWPFHPFKTVSGWGHLLHGFI